jgi:peroxiredoxin
MRPLCVIGLLAALASLAGCGSSSTSGQKSGRPWSQDQLNNVAGQFHNNPANKTVSGDQIPLKFVDMNGKDVDLASFRNQKNVVLVVVKGMPKEPGGIFCPGCLAQVNSLTANHAEFVNRNAEIVMVFPGPKDVLPQFLSDGLVTDEGGKSKVPFSLVTDSDLKAVEALGIRADWARPSTYILDKAGNVVFAYVGPPRTTTDRPSVKALLEQLDKLK